MNYYLDCEFIEDGKTIDLISIGLVAEDGWEFYALNVDCDWSKASDWAKQNVLNSLPPKPRDFEYQEKDRQAHNWLRHSVIGDEILNFIDTDLEPVFWGEYCAHDWLALTQLWGSLVDKPSHFPWHCNDVIQYRESFGLTYIEDWPESLETDGNHNALMGAHTVKARWGWCEQKRKEQQRSS